MLDLLKDCYNWACNYNLSFLIEKCFWNLSSLLHILIYLSLLNSFLFLSTFYIFLKSLNNYFFRWVAYYSSLSGLSVLINYTLWPSNLFFAHSCLEFSGSRFFRFQVFLESQFFRDQVFLGPGFSRFPSRFWIEVLEVTLKNWKTSTAEVKVEENK